MDPLLSTLLSTIIQVGVFILIPTLFYLFKKDRGSFAGYIGFIKPTSRSIKYAMLISLLFVCIGVAIPLMNNNVRRAFLSPTGVAGSLRLMGLHSRTVLILLIIAIFKTSLAEEILFRGFIGHQLVLKLGFKAGNILQALIFGLVHLLLFYFLLKSVPVAVIFFLFSSVAGWAIGVVKEKYAGGSIFPGWLAHGLGNTLSYLFSAFIL